jgi:hypothetical protein
MITVSTTEYEFSHGRKPRGFGTWAFRPDTKQARDQVNAGDFGLVVWRSGTYGEAKASLGGGSWVAMP